MLLVFGWRTNFIPRIKTPASDKAGVFHSGQGFPDPAELKFGEVAGTNERFDTDIQFNW